jgi:ketosteroid isomerase-like protein
MPRKLMVVLILALASLGGVEAQKHPAAHRAGDGSQALLDLENRWVDALVKADIPELDAILADTFVDTDEDGKQTDKRGVLGALKSGDLKMASITLSDMQVHAYGDSAVVTGAAAQSGAFAGRSLVPRIVFTDTLVWRNGKWRAVASHRSAVDRP